MTNTIERNRHKQTTVHPPKECPTSATSAVQHTGGLPEFASKCVQLDLSILTSSMVPNSRLRSFSMNRENA
jgi:hypothetical protein